MYTQRSLSALRTKQASVIFYLFYHLIFKSFHLFEAKINNNKKKLNNKKQNSSTLIFPQLL